MKMYVQNLALLSAVIAFGCQSNKSENAVAAEEAQTKNVTTQETTTTSDSDKESAVQSQTIEGVVMQTNHGKDGYTAKIETKDGGVLQATVSRANLKDPKQYREFNSNEIVKLTGDSWQMGEENQLTVREINQ